MPGRYSELFPDPCFEAWFLLARSVEADIVSPYCGILINTSMGNPTVLLERFLRNRQVFRLRRRRSIPTAFIKKPRAVFFVPNFSSVFPTLSSSTQGSTSLPQASPSCPDPALKADG